MNKGPVVWEALEYDHLHKTPDWYWAVGIVAGSIALISIILGNIIFAIVVIVSTFALIVAARRVPKVVFVQLTKTGVHIDDEFRNYSTLRSFWVDNNSHLDGKSKLFFRSRSVTAPLLIIPIEEVHPESVRDHLLDMLLEEEHSETLLHKFFEYLGF